METARAARRSVHVVLALSVITLLSACSTSEPSDGSAVPSVPVSNGNCEDASEIAKTIQDGLFLPGGGGKLRNAKAVRFADPIGSIEFAVAADIEGTGLEGEDDIGVWGVGPLDGRGPIWALDAVAIKFSVWLRSAKEGSPADQQRDEAAARPESASARDCAAES